MEITLEHKMTQDSAVEKINEFLINLVDKDFIDHFETRNLEKEWKGSTMNFFFKAQKRFFNLILKGKIIATRDNVIMESDCRVSGLIGILTLKSSKEKINNIITNCMSQLFPSSS